MPANAVLAGPPEEEALRAGTIRRPGGDVAAGRSGAPNEASTATRRRRVGVAVSRLVEPATFASPVLAPEEC